MRNLLFLLGLFLLIPRVVFADVRLAVLEFRGVGVSNGLLKVLADEVRTGVVHVSNGQKIQGEKLIIMTRENMMQILKDQGLSAEDCTGECEVEIAKNIGADYVISGDITKVGSIFVLVVKLHSTFDSNLLSSESFKTKSEEELLKQSSNIGSKVFQVGLKLSSSNGDSSSSGFSNSGGFSSSNSGFGSGVNMNIQEKLKEKKCREHAQRESKRQREERVDTEVKRLQREATKAWENLRKDLVPCLELDLEERGPCQEALEGWYASATTLKVVLNSGAEKVKTDCGVREEVFDTIMRKVEVVEIKKAMEMRKRLQNSSRKEKTGFFCSTFRLFCPKDESVQGIKSTKSEAKQSDFDLTQEETTEAIRIKNQEKEHQRTVSKKGYDVVWIPAGSFAMGCTKGDSDCKSNEKPSHKVTLTKGFYMMTTEVTQGLYKDVMGDNPSNNSSCANCPVENVSWYDVVKMANKLSEKDGQESCYQIGSGSRPSVSWNNKDCTGWRLPTEAEWEYAARGGEDYKYAGSNNIDEVAWYSSNSGSQTHPVGQKKANGYGLYDMSGNAWEWVWDSWKREYGSSVTDPVYIDTSNSLRVYRGGSWRDVASYTRVSNRIRYKASFRNNHYFEGFRFLRSGLPR